jgi:hypothetical protein
MDIKRGLHALGRRDPDERQRMWDALVVWQLDGADEPLASIRFTPRP